MTKNLYLIGGPMGIGKTTVARILVEKLSQAAYFDGDWAWDLHPFVVNDATIKMVHGNIAFILQQFLQNSEIENIVFTWVMQEQGIIDKILTDLSDCEFQLYNISLIADEATLIRNFTADSERDTSGLAKTLSYLPKYEKLNSVKLDRTGKRPEATVSEILQLRPINL